MTGRLQSKVAVVTGSNSGIGRGIALAFGREGATVICASRQAESKAESERETTHDLIAKNGGKAVFIKLTFSETSSVNAVVAEIVEKFGRIDVWVNNAGTSGGSNPIWQMTDDEFDTNIDVNLKGTFRCMRTVSAQMIKQDLDAAGLRGRIINTCSVFGPRGFATTAGYSASKLGTMGMIRAAVMDLSPHRVTVNAICPGTVATSATAHLPAEVNEVLQRKALMGFGQPEDVAGAAVYLASDDAKWVQGLEMFVDGGFTVS